MTKSFVTNKTKMARVTNGKDVSYPIPWQIAVFNIMIRDPCGGTIINDLYILTAAHCFDDDAFETIASNIFIQAGITNLKKTESHKNMQKIFVRKIIIHPNFKRNDDQDTDNDIAILKLKQSLSFNDFVQPACLPDHSIDLHRLKYDPVVSGWGRNDGIGNMILS